MEFWAQETDMTRVPGWKLPSRERPPSSRARTDTRTGRQVGDSAADARRPRVRARRGLPHWAPALPPDAPGKEAAARAAPASTASAASAAGACAPRGRIYTGGSGPPPPRPPPPAAPPADGRRRAPLSARAGKRGGGGGFCFFDIPESFLPPRPRVQRGEGGP